MEGVVKAGDKIKMMATGKEFEVSEVGINTPKQLPIEELTVGDVGYIIASIKMLMTHVWVIQLLMLIDQLKHH